MSYVIENWPENSEKNSIKVYKWDVKFYDTDSGMEIFPSKVNTVRILSDYKNKAMPEITMNITLKYSDIVALKNITKTCLCLVYCNYIEYSPTNNPSSAKYLVSSTGISFSETFIPIFESNIFKSKYDSDKLTEKEARNEIDGGRNADVTRDETEINVALISQTSQNAIKTMFNQVIESGNKVGTVLQWVIDELPIYGCIVDPPDNTATLGCDIVIPPMNALQVLNYLQTTYGMYENGLQVFFDKDNILYILDKWGLEHEVQEDYPSTTHIFIDDANNNLTDVTRSYDENGEPMYLGNIKVAENVNDVADGEINGDIMIFSSFNQSIDAVSFVDQEVEPSTARPVAITLKRNAGTHASSGDRVIADYDELNNPYNVLSYFNEIEAKVNKIQLVVSNCDIEDFKPNMFIELNFRNNEKQIKYGGVYYINQVGYQFVVDNALSNFEENSDSMLGNPKKLNKTYCSVYLTLSRKNISDSSDDK